MTSVHGKGKGSGKGSGRGTLEGRCKLVKGSRSREGQPTGICACFSRQSSRGPLPVDVQICMRHVRRRPAHQHAHQIHQIHQIFHATFDCQWLQPSVARNSSICIIKHANFCLSKHRTAHPTFPIIPSPHSCCFGIPSSVLVGDRVPIYGQHGKLGVVIIGER